MKIYLSIPKGLSSTSRNKVIAALKDHQCDYFKGGEYSPNIVTRKDTSILLLRGLEETQVGRGQYDEGNRSALAGQEPKCIHYNSDTNLFHLFEIEDMQVKEGTKTWQTWADIDLTEIGQYTAVELNNLYNI